MKRGLWIWIVIAAVIAVGVLAAVNFRNQPPEIPFAKAVREAISDSVPTNGKVEPIEWAEARAEKPGSVQKILVQRGQHVAKGDVLIELDSSEAKADLAAAEARVSAVRAELDVIERGGRATDLTAISTEADRVRLELQTEQRELASLVRLQQKKAATDYEVQLARERVEKTELQLKSLGERRTALIAPPDKSTAMARLHDAESAVALADERIKKSVLRAPIGGTVYGFDLKPGAYLNAGDLVATIGRLEQVEVRVYVDEPDLGRVAKGMQVVLTWDAKPGKQWTGTVDRTPTQIVALGTRQVGEVLCVIQNPENELLPGTNVNAEIRSKTVSSAVTVPKEAVRREDGKTGVYVLVAGTNGDAKKNDASKVQWKPVTVGVSSTTRSEVSGLNEGDAVALPSDTVLSDGLEVKPRFP
jgi:HlyD family secretion protein